MRASASSPLSSNINTYKSLKYIERRESVCQNHRIKNEEEELKSMYDGPPLFSIVLSLRCSVFFLFQLSIITVVYIYIYIYIYTCAYKKVPHSPSCPKTQTNGNKFMMSMREDTRTSMLGASYIFWNFFFFKYSI